MWSQYILPGLLAFSALTFAIPAPQQDQPFPSRNSLATRSAGNADSCPGYAASNVVKTDSSLTADLTLAGDACNAFGEDIKNLKLLVEYQTSKSRLSNAKLPSLFILRHILYSTAMLNQK